ncbi:MAG TPA: hypothetical protein VFK96_02670 [Gammaproteobacteria bacterium]|nr:hypothetical protein [Gammaproteobacteria bacterium]
MKTIPALLLGGALLALAAGAAAADEQSATHSMHSVSQPVHGMTMQNVVHIFGEPVKKIPAVGDPPITRWVYPHYVVYFERDIVLHTVSKAKPFHDAPPTPVTHIVSGATG